MARRMGTGMKKLFLILSLLALLLCKVPGTV